MSMNPGNLTRPGEYAASGAALDAEALAAAAVHQIENAEAPADAPRVEPIELWRSSLRDAGITEEKAGEILDSMLVNGYWQRDYSLFRGKVPITLRTRDSHNIQRIMRAIDRLRIPTDALVQQTVAQYNLSASLVRFRDVTLIHPDSQKATVDEIEDAFNKRLEFVSRIPGPVAPAVITALANFDKIVAAALANGAAEGF